MITILNARNGWISSAEYVGRKNPKHVGSALANPFKVEQHSGAYAIEFKAQAHRAVVKQYREWLWRNIQDCNGPVCMELARLKQLSMAGELQLMCWCNPLPCHAGTIKSCLEWAIRTGYEF